MFMWICAIICEWLLMMTLQKMSITILHIAKRNLFSYKITIIKLYYDKVDQFSEYQNWFSNEFIKPFCNEDRAHCVHQIIVT